MKTGYFDFESASGFTLRLNWKEENGVVTLIAPTGIQLRSREYSGPTWYPKGTISVNGKPLLEMDYASPATHAFSLYSASDVFVDIETLSGKSLPVSTEKITAEKAVITVDVELYRNGSSPKPRFTGSAEIKLLSGLVRIQTTNGPKRHRAYVKRNGQPVPVTVQVKHSGKITMCN